ALDARLKTLGNDIAAKRTHGSEGDEAHPTMRVEFGVGHRMTVETEAIVRQESIMNTVGSLALILPLLFIVYRSFWLVFVGPLPSALSLVGVLGLLVLTRARPS